MRYTPSEVHTLEVHANEVHVHEMHTHEVYAHEMHTHEGHAHEIGMDQASSGLGEFACGVTSHTNR
jgi:hypothetical protein